ncbi:GNAT family N-acetyltransferase [Chiayiivirga flava]|uniref:GNAT superfamily N-acetyltransferase n=1 Tax=Chiayiivirga flava TaxID=659595 RepID=A0A7W8D9A1_9GAMM|nr:GNAT family N-acetyltransferase [Chiayiivirga flava]MBB5209145.1 GNAT superfamily N-acetyltransferase [Chiayiivirga flava]
MPPLRIATLDASRDRGGFRSGSDPLDRYLREQAAQDVRRRIAACHVLLDGERIVGYYTLGASSVPLHDLPQTLAKKLPRYPLVPAVRLGRLAIDRSLRGQGYGSALLADALQRSARADIAAYALLVDAKDEIAAAFYRHHDFIALVDAANTLFLPLSGVAALVAAAGFADR